MSLFQLQMWMDFSYSVHSVYGISITSPETRQSRSGAEDKSNTFNVIRISKPGSNVAAVRLLT